VISAADALYEKNEKYPTVAAVREAIGNKGSNSTISNHLKQWKNEKLLVDKASGIKKRLTAGLYTQVDALSDAIWDDMSFESNVEIERLNADIAMISEELTIRTNEWVETKKNLNSLGAEHETLKEKYKGLGDVNKQQVSINKELKLTNENQREKIESHASSIAELTEKKRDARNQQRDAEELYQAKCSEFLSTSEEKNREIQEYIAENAKLKQQLLSAIKDVEEWESKCAQGESKLDELNKAISQNEVISQEQQRVDRDNMLKKDHEIERTKETIKDLRENIKAKDTEHKETKSRVKELEKLLVTISKKARSVKTRS